MAAIEPSTIRNFAVVGHRGCGKTSLIEMALYAGAAKNRLGTISDGNTTTDFDEDEIRRQMTISASPAHVQWDEREINFIDTPGEVSFINEAMGVLGVVENVLVVVNALNKVEVQAERVWKKADELGLARMIAVNMLDRERASFDDVVSDLEERFGSGVVPLGIPIGAEEDFVGVVDLLEMKAYTYDGNPAKPEVKEIPSDMAESVEEARERLMDSVAETDDTLIEKYLEGEQISFGEVAAAFKTAVAEGVLYPILPVSSTKGVGVDRILANIVAVSPSPVRYGPREISSPDGSATIQITADKSEPTAAYVFKTLYDQFAGRINLVRIFSGSASTDSHLLNMRTKGKERTSNILRLQGKESHAISEAGAGEIVALSKLKDTSTGDTLCDPSREVVFPAYEFPPPAISFAITPKVKGEEEKVTNALRRLSEEDPAMQMRLDQQTKELIISGTSQIHVEVILDKMKRRFGVEVDLHPPQVPYRETIRKKTYAQGRHKKQTGGRGQFGDAWIEIEPLPRGAGYEFEDAIVGGAIPRSYIPAVEKGIIEAMEHGVLTGCPVVDVKIRLYDGSYHAVDSSEMAFKIAGSLAFKKAMESASPVLLEPVMNVEVVVPEANMGDIMGDLSSRRGRPQGSESMGDMQSIRAQVPLAEMLSYAPQLRSMTGGRGMYTMEFDHYEEVPAQIAEKITEEARAKKEEG